MTDRLAFSQLGVWGLWGWGGEFRWSLMNPDWEPRPERVLFSEQTSDEITAPGYARQPVENVFYGAIGEADHFYFGADAPVFNDVELGTALGSLVLWEERTDVIVATWHLDGESVTGPVAFTFPPYPQAGYAESLIYQFETVPGWTSYGASET